MRCSRVVFALAFMPAIASAQSATITSANASGDCTGTSFHQSTDASGRFLSAEWAVAGQFPIAVNRGRSRCAIRFSVAVTTGHKIVPGGGAGVANRLGIARVSYLRLNGAASGVLVASAISIDASAPATATSVLNSGPTTGTSLLQDRPAGSPAFESACSTASKSTFQLVAVVDVAAASNYVTPWPPEPYSDRETASMGGYRLFYNVVPCGPSRSAATEGATLKP